MSTRTTRLFIIPQTSEVSKDIVNSSHSKSNKPTYGYTKNTHLRQGILTLTTVLKKKTDWPTRLLCIAEFWIKVDVCVLISRKLAFWCSSRFLFLLLSNLVFSYSEYTAFKLEFIYSILSIKMNVYLNTVISTWYDPTRCLSFITYISIWQSENENVQQ